MHQSLPVGSVRLMAGGYLKVKIGRGYKDWGYQHRHVMEQHLGRSLTSRENVHHRDGDKTNNELSNLELIHISDHARLHRTGVVTSPHMRASALALTELGFSRKRAAEILGCTQPNITRHIQRAQGITRRSRAAMEG